MYVRTAAVSVQTDDDEHSPHLLGEGGRPLNSQRGRRCECLGQNNCPFDFQDSMRNKALEMTKTPAKVTKKASLLRPNSLKGSWLCRVIVSIARCSLEEGVFLAEGDVDWPELDEDERFTNDVTVIPRRSRSPGLLPTLVPSRGTIHLKGVKGSVSGKPLGRDPVQRDNSLASSQGLCNLLYLCLSRPCLKKRSLGKALTLY